MHLWAFRGDKGDQTCKGRLPAGTMEGYPDCCAAPTYLRWRRRTGGEAALLPGEVDQRGRERKDSAAGIKRGDKSNDGERKGWCLDMKKKGGRGGALPNATILNQNLVRIKLTQTSCLVFLNK